jgi:hypothetical protein
MRRQLNIPPDAIVFGIVGSLVWNPRARYCYGYELLRAIRQVDRADIVVLVGGSGSGLDKLRRIAGTDLGKRVFLPGEIPADRVPEYLAGLDVGTLPQSVDGVGSFRYTTKISEYLAARLPFVTNQIPLSYDLPSEWMWRLPGKSPWDRAYVKALSHLMCRVTKEQIHTRRDSIVAIPREFNEEVQMDRATEFICDILASQNSHSL